MEKRVCQKYILMTLVSLKSVKVYIGDANTNDYLTKVSFIQLLFIECFCANTVQSTKNISTMSFSLQSASADNMAIFSKFPFIMLN